MAKTRAELEQEIVLLTRDLETLTVELAQCKEQRDQARHATDPKWWKKGQEGVTRGKKPE